MLFAILLALRPRYEEEMDEEMMDGVAAALDGEAAHVKPSQGEDGDREVEENPDAEAVKPPIKRRRTTVKKKKKKKAKKDLIPPPEEKIKEKGV